MLGFTRRPYMENAIGFSFGFTNFGESAVTFGGLAANETAELVQKALANFCVYDRRPPTAVRNRRSDLVDFNISVSFGGRDRRS